LQLDQWKLSVYMPIETPELLRTVGCAQLHRHQRCKIIDVAAAVTIGE